MITSHGRAVMVAGVALALAAMSCQQQEVQPAPAATQPVPTRVAWQPYAAGLAKASAEHKPICLVVTASWCPHCRNYSHVFEDPQVIAKADRFVMIRLDEDAEPDAAANYRLDGGYVPRTFFLSPDGVAAPDIHEARSRYPYFYDEHDPASLLAGMDAALTKLAR